MENKKSKLGLGIFIGVLVGIIIGLSGFMIYDKLISNDSKIDSANEDKTNKDNDNITDEISYDKITYNVVTSENAFELSINNKKVEGINGNSIEVIKQVKDALIVKTFDLDYFNYYFVDKNAKILAKIVGSGEETDNNVDYQILKLTGNFAGECSFDADDLLCRSDNVQSEPQYISCSKGDSDIVEYVEKINYLGNGKFSNPTIRKKITAKEYISTHNILCD